MTAERIAAVSMCLRMLAGMDGDRARMRNDIGFNAMDGEIGHDLASRGSLSPKQAALGLMIVRKYHRQLPAALLATAKGEQSPEGE